MCSFVLVSKVISSKPFLIRKNVNCNGNITYPIVNFGLSGFAIHLVPTQKISEQFAFFLISR